MLLTDIRDNEGARRKSKRVGRGEGSGKGKTCGSGTKGQKARTGVSIHGFEGGQTPLYQRIPKRGFSNVMFQTPTTEITLAQLQRAVDSKKIDAKKEITIDVLKAARLVRKPIEQVKLIATGELTTALTLTLSRASEAAVKAVEKAKGTITLTATTVAKA